MHVARVSLDGRHQRCNGPGGFLEQFLDRRVDFDVLDQATLVFPPPRTLAHFHEANDWTAPYMSDGAWHLVRKVEASTFKAWRNNGRIQPPCGVDETNL